MRIHRSLLLAVIPCLLLAGQAWAAPSSQTSSKIDELRGKARELQQDQRQLNQVRRQRVQAERRMPLLRRQVAEAQKIADRAESAYQRMSREAAVSRRQLDRLTVEYIGSVEGIGYSRAMMGEGVHDLGALAGTSSPEDAVLVYSQGQMMVNQMQVKLDRMRALASDAAERRKRAEAARLSALVARQEADASLERQRQLSELLKRSEASKRGSMRYRQSQLAGLFNELLGDPDLPGVDVSLMGLPSAQRITLLALREWKKGVQEEPLGSNDSADIARYRTATQGAVRGGAWCAYFVSYIVRRAGHPIGVGGSGTGWVPSIADWGRSNQRFFAADDKKYKPQGGDIIIWPAHTGIVISAQGNRMVTVEGNSSDRVARQTRAVNRAVGFVRVYGSPLKGAKKEGNPSAGSPGGGIL